MTNFVAGAWGYFPISYFSLLSPIAMLLISLFTTIYRLAVGWSSMTLPPNSPPARAAKARAASSSSVSTLPGSTKTPADGVSLRKMNQQNKSSLPAKGQRSSGCGGGVSGGPRFRGKKQQPQQQPQQQQKSPQGSHIAVKTKQSKLITQTDPTKTTSPKKNTKNKCPRNKQQKVKDNRKNNNNNNNNNNNKQQIAIRTSIKTKSSPSYLIANAVTMKESNSVVNPNNNHQPQHQHHHRHHHRLATRIRSETRTVRNHKKQR